SWFRAASAASVASDKLLKLPKEYATLSFFSRTCQPSRCRCTFLTPDADPGLGPLLLWVFCWLVASLRCLVLMHSFVKQVWSICIPAGIGPFASSHATLWVSFGPPSMLICP